MSQEVSTMAHAGTVSPPRIPRLGIKFEVIREKGGGGGEPDPEDKRGPLRKIWDGLRNFIQVRVK
jgi:hypothetical protein